MDELIQELKLKIIDILNMPDVHPEDISENDRLVGGPLGIDSIDILEVVIMLEKDYNVVVGNRELGAHIFATLRTLADYIQTQAVVN